jgi:hypothetical protein
MSWNKDGAISYAKSHAQPRSTGYCAHYVTKAIRVATFVYTMGNSGLAILYNAPCTQDRHTATYSHIMNYSGMTNEKTLLFTFRPVTVRSR